MSPIFGNTLKKNFCLCQGDSSLLERSTLQILFYTPLRFRIHINMNVFPNKSGGKFGNVSVTATEMDKDTICAFNLTEGL